MRAFVAALRWDVVLQARHRFYWVTAFVVLAVGGLLLAVPEAIRAERLAWVPAMLVVNLQMTTYFFVAGLILLERDEGTLAALAVTPFSAGQYLAARTITLTLLAVVETVAIIWIVFGTDGAWLLILAGALALGAIYTGFGAVAASRYASVNELLLPSAVFVTLLLLPLLPHFGFAPRLPFLLHPVEPPLVLLRAGYGAHGSVDLAYGVAGSIVWSALAFLWGRRGIRRVMRDTRAAGGR